MGNLSEGRIVRQGDRVATNKIYYFRVGQLLVEECRSFAFERFSVNELVFENTAAVIGYDAINHQERRKRVVESEFEGHQDRHQWGAGGRCDKRPHAHNTAHSGIQLKTRESIEKSSTIQHSNCGTYKECRCKYTSNCAGSKRCGSRYQLKQKYRENLVRKPILTKEGGKQPLTVAAHIGTDHRQGTDHCSAERELCWCGDIDCREETFSRTQES